MNHQYVTEQLRELDRTAHELEHSNEAILDVIQRVLELSPDAVPFVTEWEHQVEGQYINLYPVLRAALLYVNTIGRSTVTLVEPVDTGLEENDWL